MRARAAKLQGCLFVAGSMRWAGSKPAFMCLCPGHASSPVRSAWGSGAARRQGQEGFYALPY